MALGGDEAQATIIRGTSRKEQRVIRRDRDIGMDMVGREEWAKTVKTGATDEG
jgi:hypothetical protein